MLTLSAYLMLQNQFNNKDIDGILKVRNFICVTRMHSSRMFTSRSLTVCRSLLPGRGGYLPVLGGVPAQGGCTCLSRGGGVLACPREGVVPACPRRVYLPVQGGVPAGGLLPGGWGVCTEADTPL